MISDAEAAVVEVLEHLGFELCAPDGRADLAVDIGRGRHVQLAVKAVTNASPSRVSRQIATGSKDTTPVLVADAIPAASRQLLDEARWGWLDRRGHFRLQAPGVHVDTDVAQSPRRVSSAPSAPITGRAGLAVALGLLLSPHESLPIRATARMTDLNPSSISRALRRLQKAALLESDGRPLLPELFWALADTWPRESLPLKHEPSPEDPSGTMQMNLGDLDATGWALSGTRGALAWGAPVVATERQPAELYVPSPAIERRISQREGVAPSRSAAGATVHAAPVPTVLFPRWRRPGEKWPVAHPLVVALDLATDASRGAEILGDWQPPGPFVRVW